jgi:hypothetical protein
MPESTEHAPSLVNILTRFQSGEVSTVEEACGQVWQTLLARLPAPEDPNGDFSDYEAGYLDGVNDCRDVQRAILAQFCNAENPTRGRERTAVHR